MAGLVSILLLFALSGTASTAQTTDGTAPTPGPAVPYLPATTTYLDRRSADATAALLDEPTDLPTPITPSSFSKLQFTPVTWTTTKRIRNVGASCGFVSGSPDNELTCGGFGYECFISEEPSWFGCCGPWVQYGSSDPVSCDGQVTRCYNWGEWEDWGLKSYMDDHKDGLHHPYELMCPEYEPYCVTYVLNRYFEGANATYSRLECASTKASTVQVLDHATHSIYELWNSVEFYSNPPLEMTGIATETGRQVLAATTTRRTGVSQSVGCRVYGFGIVGTLFWALVWGLVLFV